jgi:TrmH family RNA methyltransferase
MRYGATLTRREILAIRTLVRDRGAREAEGVVVAEGRKIVEEAIRRGARIRYLVVDHDASERAEELARIVEGARRAGIPCAETDARGYARLSDVKSPQGILAVLERPRWELQERIGQEASLVVVADAIQDPANVGLLVRIALAFEVDALVLTPGSADPYGPKALRTASGAVLDLPIFSRSVEDVRSLAARGFSLFATAPSARETLAAIRPEGKRNAVVFGNEGRGVSAELLRGPVRTFRIPISTRVESLNVTAAAGIVLHHFRAARSA